MQWSIFIKWNSEVDMRTKKINKTRTPKFKLSFKIEYPDNKWVVLELETNQVYHSSIDYFIDRLNKDIKPMFKEMQEF